MLRSLVSTARRQRFVALLGVITLAIAVPPAFGGSSVATQVAKALKLATKANTTAAKANTNAANALKLAKTASGGAAGTSGEAGAKGATGDKGAAGANGANGATGPAGPAGPAGAKGEKGEAGAKGDTGAQGIQGIPGTSPAGGGAPAALSARAATPTAVAYDSHQPLADPTGVDPLVSVQPTAKTAYVVTAHVSLSNSSQASTSCLLSSGSTVLDSGIASVAYPTYVGDLALTALVPAADTPDPIGVTCTSDAPLTSGKASMTAIAVTTAP